MIAVRGLSFLYKYKAIGEMMAPLELRTRKKYLVEWRHREDFVMAETELLARRYFAMELVRYNPDLDLTLKYVEAEVRATWVPATGNPQPTPVIPILTVIPTVTPGGATHTGGTIIAPVNLPIAPGLGGGWTGDGRPSPGNMPAERFGEKDGLEWWNPADWDDFLRKGVEKVPGPGPGIPYYNAPWQGKYPGSNPFPAITDAVTGAVDFTLMMVMMMAMRR